MSVVHLRPPSVRTCMYMVRIVPDTAGRMSFRLYVRSTGQYDETFFNFGKIGLLNYWSIFLSLPPPPWDVCGGGGG